MSAVPILMYHEVTPRPVAAFQKYCVTPKAFASQMKWLARAGYVAIDMRMLLECRSGRAKLPRRPVVITFDDGFRDCFSYATPILLEYGFTATFYLVAGCMGKTAKWLLSIPVERELMDWTSARCLESNGFHCGSHSVDHPHLSEVTPDVCQRELAHSRQILEDRLGHEVCDLAYPYGSYSPIVQAIAAQVGYRSACSVRIGFSSVDDDVMALHRIPISGHDSLLEFICRVRTAQTARELWRGVWKHIWPISARSK